MSNYQKSNGTANYANYAKAGAGQMGANYSNFSRVSLRSAMDCFLMGV